MRHQISISKIKTEACDISYLARHAAQETEQQRALLDAETGAEGTLDRFQMDTSNF
jgi:hypothetical protein